MLAPPSRLIRLLIVQTARSGCCRRRAVASSSCSLAEASAPTAKNHRTAMSLTFYTIGEVQIMGKAGISVNGS
jgi:hypothetical protein